VDECKPLVSGSVSGSGSSSTSAVLGVIPPPLEWRGDYGCVRLLQLSPDGARLFAVYDNGSWAGAYTRPLLSSTSAVSVTRKHPAPCTPPNTPLPRATQPLRATPIPYKPFKLS